MRTALVVALLASGCGPAMEGQWEGPATGHILSVKQDWRMSLMLANGVVSGTAGADEVAGSYRDGEAELTLKGFTLTGPFFSFHDGNPTDGLHARLNVMEGGGEVGFASLYLRKTP